MGLTIKVGDVRRSFDNIKEKYGYGEDKILDVLHNQKVWSQDLDYRFVYDLLKNMYKCASDKNLEDNDNFDLITDGLSAYNFYYKSENMIFKRMLNYIGILRTEDFNVNIPYFYEVDSRNCKSKIEEFIKEYENLSELKDTINRFNQKEFWNNPGYGTDVAFYYDWIHELLEPVIKKYEEILAVDVYKYNIKNVKDCALQVVNIQEKAANLYDELDRYYKTERGREEMARCIILGFNPLTELDRLSSNDFEMEDGKLKIVNNREFYNDAECDMDLEEHMER